MNKFLQSLLSFLYPPLCSYCSEWVENEKDYLCNQCQSFLELLDPEERCLFCFGLSKKSLCLRCSQEVPLWDGLGCALSYEGPAGCLVRRMKYQDEPDLSRGLSAYLAVQFLRLNWPFPDVIIPVPTTRMHLLQRHYNQSLLLALGLGEWIGRPVKDVLKRKSGDFSQAGLTKKQRMMLGSSCFLLREGQHGLEDKDLLLIDDVMTTGSTLKHCARLLLAECPKSLRVMTVCRTEK